jgi:hypothetical protein
MFTKQSVGHRQSVITACLAQKTNNNNNDFPMKEEATHLFLQRKTLARKRGKPPTSAEYPKAQTTLTDKYARGRTTPKTPFAPKGAETTTANGISYICNCIKIEY